MDAIKAIASNPKAAGSLLATATGGGTIPLPSLTGGAAAPSQASTGTIGGNTVIATSGGGMLFPSIAVIIGLLIWKHYKK